MTFHKKTSVPRDPWLALVREDFTHHAGAVKRCSWILQMESQEDRSEKPQITSRHLFGYCNPKKDAFETCSCNNGDCRQSLICPTTVVLSSSCSHFSCSFPVKVFSQLIIGGCYGNIAGNSSGECGWGFSFLILGMWLSHKRAWGTLQSKLYKLIRMDLCSHFQNQLPWPNVIKPHSKIRWKYAWILFSNVLWVIMKDQLCY